MPATPRWHARCFHNGRWRPAGSRREDRDGHPDVQRPGPRHVRSLAPPRPRSARRRARRRPGRPPPVAALPTGCFYYVLSGGPALNDPIEIDDDLTVSLNGTPLLEDVDGVTNILDPIAFQAAPGDELTVTARDAQGPCRKIGALWLHCAIGGDPVRLTTGQDDGCDPARPVPEVFFTQTWVIGA